MDSTNKLTEKQKQFVDFYIETGDKTKSARKAGYKQPESQGHQNYEKLRNHIDARLKEKEDARIAKGDEVLRFFTSVMRGEVTEEVPLLIGGGEQQLTKKDASVRGRIEAAKQLGKRFGLEQPENSTVVPIEETAAKIEAHLAAMAGKKADETVS